MLVFKLLFSGFTAIGLFILWFVSTAIGIKEQLNIAFLIGVLALLGCLHALGYMKIHILNESHKETK